MTRRPSISRALPALVAVASVLAPAWAGAESVGGFPNLEPWPTTLALGGAPKALGQGVDAVLENPTGMLLGDGRALAFSHASLFTGGLVHHQAAAALFPSFEEKNVWQAGQVVAGRGAIRSALGIGVTNLSGELPGNDTYGETQIALAYAHRFSGGVRSGVRVRFLQARSTVDGSGGTGTAIDAGLEGDWGGWRIGGVARALYSRVNWDRSIDGPLPTGFDAAIERGIRSDLRAIVGATLPSSGKPSRLALGLDMGGSAAPRSFSWPARLGGTTRSSLAARSPPGMSLRVGPVRAEYGMRTGPDALGEIHRFGLQVALP